MSFEIGGEYNTATVHGQREMFDDSCIGQIQEMVNHEAFYGDEDIAIMPDGHWGSGAVIGFTMPIKDCVVPNTIGFDIGCGMYATQLDTPEFEKTDDVLSDIDEAIRCRVPIGVGVVHDRNDYHVLNDFPWDVCAQKLESFDTNSGFDLPDGSDTYDSSYFTDLCNRVGYDQTRAINSIGSLGANNHFIELGTDSSDNVWSIIHSGSRGIGAAIAEHWQDEATDRTYERNALVTIPEADQPYIECDEGLVDATESGDGSLYAKASALSIDYDAVRSDYDGEAIDGKIGQLQSYLNAGKSDSSPLDYLDGDEAIGYIIDMIFAQTYASESRKQMAQAVNEGIAEALGFDYAPAFFEDSIESVHNYIDFEDATIRKGACSAHTGERLVVPFNMAVGTIIARGKGRDDWNSSSAHGAGRAMSRTAAEDRFDQDDFDSQVGDVFMSEQPLDECPKSYKDPEHIEAALGDSVDVIDRIKPFLSIKAA